MKNVNIIVMASQFRMCKMGNSGDSGLRGIEGRSRVLLEKRMKNTSNPNRLKVTKGKDQNIKLDIGW